MLDAVDDVLHPDEGHIKGLHVLPTKHRLDFVFVLLRDSDQV